VNALSRKGTIEALSTPLFGLSQGDRALGHHPSTGTRFSSEERISRRLAVLPMPAAARLKLSIIHPNGYKYNSCAEAGLAAVGGD